MKKEKSRGGGRYGWFETKEEERKKLGGGGSGGYSRIRLHPLLLFYVNVLFFYIGFLVMAFL